MVSRRLLGAAFLLFLALPGRAVPTFDTKEINPAPVLNAGVGGVRFSSAVMVAISGSYTDAGGGVRGFFIRGSSAGVNTSGIAAPALSSAIFSARSVNGLNWVDEPGVRVSSNTLPKIDIAVSSITGATVLPLNGGGFAMIYSVYGTTGSFRLYLASSTDGLNWVNEFSTPVITAANGGMSFLGSPSMVQLQNGNWMLYYVQNSLAGNQPANHQVLSALSTNSGGSFAAPIVEFSPANEVAAMERTDGRVRLIYTTPLQNSTTSVQLLSQLSVGVFGHVFNNENTVWLSTTAGVGSMYQPVVVRSTEAAPSFRWRVYYTYIPFATSPSSGDVQSAVTDTPNLVSISPTQILASNPNQQFTMTGEIFDPALTTKLAGAVTLPGVPVVVNNDQTITATFATQGAPQGGYTPVVTNFNGLTSGIPGAVTITFSDGYVSLTNNLFRPAQGGKVTINVVTFAAGVVTVRLYTLKGQLVDTIWDGALPQGTTTFSWAANTTHGQIVASGVYLLKVNGPKINSVSKIIVIK